MGGGSSLTLSLTCGNKGYFPTQYDDDAKAGYVKLVNIASTYFYVKGTGIGRASDDLDMAMLPADHPGRAWGAKRWGDLWGAKMQPRYEVDILLTATPQPDPPVFFATGTRYEPINDEKGNVTGRRVEGRTATVTRRHDTIPYNQRVNLIRYCALDSKETISITINGSIIEQRPRSN